ncbi:MAG: hypothetical protein R3E88_11815 [Myxococcota bacterium]
MRARALGADGRPRREQLAHERRVAVRGRDAERRAPERVVCLERRAAREQVAHARAIAVGRRFEQLAREPVARRCRFAAVGLPLHGAPLRPDARRA